MAKKNADQRLEAFEQLLEDQKMLIPASGLSEAAKAGQEQRIAYLTKFHPNALVKYETEDGRLGEGYGRPDRRMFNETQLAVIAKGKEVGYFPIYFEVYEYNAARHFWRLGKKTSDLDDALNAI